MQLADLLKETLDVDCQEVWENERTPTPVRMFGVRLHSMGLSVREVAAVLGWLSVERSHGAVWNWTHKLAEQQEDPPTAGVVSAMFEYGFPSTSSYIAGVSRRL